MADNFVKDNTGNQRNLPQYGKKGHKPRRDFKAPQVEYDNLHWNDPSYWNKLTTFNNVTKFAWDTVVGFPKPVSQIFAPGTKTDQPIVLSTDPMFNAINPTSMMVLHTIIGPGYAENVNDGVNLGLASIMAKIRASLSTSNIGFETADLGIFFASTGSIATMIGQVKRLLEARLSNRDRNYLYPRGIIKTLGNDYDDIYNNINQYAARLNKCIDRYNELGMVDGFDIYGRQYALAHSLFMDEDSAYGQMYAFQIDNYYVYHDAPNNDPSHAECKMLRDTKITTMLDAIEEMLNAWYGSSDLYTINGVLLRAFKEAPRQHIPNFSMDDVISPTVDRSFLMQIMNLSIVPMSMTTGTLRTFDITQEPTAQNYVIWKPKAKPASEMPNKVVLTSAYAERQMLRLFEEDISNEDNAEMTRLLNFVERDGSMPNCGSEIITGVSLYSYDSTRDQVWSTSLDSQALVQDDVSVGSAVFRMQPFRYIPCVNVWTYVNSESPEYVVEYNGVIGDLYNWMLYSKRDWRQLQNEMYRSLWTTKL